MGFKYCGMDSACHTFVFDIQLIINTNMPGIMILIVRKCHIPRVYSITWFLILENKADFPAIVNEDILNSPIIIIMYS